MDVLLIITISFAITSTILHLFAGDYSAVVSLSIVAVLVTFIICEEREKPQAIDVYKGKTTLQVTYEDSIPIDTVVIFKK